MCYTAVYNDTWVLSIGAYGCPHNKQQYCVFQFSSSNEYLTISKFKFNDNYYIRIDSIGSLFYYLI